MENGEATGLDPAPSDRRARNRRPYRSRLREDRAADTRRRIATAARDLFAEHGFAGTTVTGIAERAGVSAPTVYATFGSKGALLRALLTQLETDADAAGWRARIDTEQDPHRKLGAFAEWTAAMFSTSKAVIAAARGASSDPAMIELRRQGDQHRREALRRLLSTMADSLRDDITEQQAVDRAWMLTGVDMYLNATEGCGWSDTDYQQWLSQLLQAQLLGSASTSGG